MSQMMPQGYYYPQQQYMQPQLTGMDINVQNAMGSCRNVLNSLLGSGQISQAEYNSIGNILNNPQSQSGLIQEIKNQWGYTQVNVQEIFNWLMRRFLTIAQSMRMNQQPVYMQQPVYTNQPVQSMPMNVQMPGQQNQQIDFNQMYGKGQQQQMSQVMSPQPVQHQQQEYRQPQAPATNVTPNRVQNTPTGAECNVQFTDDVQTAPAILPIPLPYNQQEFVNQGYTINNAEIFGFNGHKAFVAAVTLDDSYTSNRAPAKKCANIVQEFWNFINSAKEDNHEVGEVEVENIDISDEVKEQKEPEYTVSAENKRELANTDGYAILADFSKPVVVETMFDRGKRTVQDIVNIVNGKEQKKLDPAIGKLKSCGSEFQNAIGNELLKSFNNAARVSFVQLETSSIITAVEDLDELKDIYSDSGKHEEWKADKYLYKRALQSTLQASIGRMFSKTKKLWLDPKNPNDVRKMLANEEIRISLKLPDDITVADAMKHYEESLERVFVYLLPRKVLFHTYQWPDNLKNLNIGSIGKFMDPSFQLFGRLFGKFGSYEAVNLDNPNDMTNPLVIGISYNNVFMARRLRA